MAAIQMKTAASASPDADDQLSGKAAKLKHAMELVSQAAENGAQLIVLGETFNLDYEIFFRRDTRYFSLAEPIPGPTLNAVGRVAKKHGCYVVAPIFERSMPGVFYNSAPVVGPSGKVIGNYRKTHVAGGLALEKLYFRNGDEFPIFSVGTPSNAKFGIAICYDSRFPETARILAIHGAEIFVNPVARTTGYWAHLNWDTMNISRAFDNMIYGIYVNRVGKEFERTFFGSSMIVDPSGKILKKADAKSETILSATLDLDKITAERVARPLLRDFRYDLYLKHYTPDF